jgi:hypothetical protein
MPEEQSRGEELAEASDASREELLEAIEEADDLLVEVLGHANTYVSHEKVRPSATLGFDKAEEAQSVLAEADPTRTFEDDEGSE